MANKHRGEVALEVDGKAYVMRLSTNALCSLEGVMQKTAPQVFDGLEKNFDMRTLRAIVWASLTDGNADITLQEAGDLIDTVGVKVAIVKIGELSSVTFPRPDAGEASPENPQ